MPSPPVTPTEYRALAEFRHQLLRFLRFSEQAARRAGLAPQQHQLLLAIHGMPAGTAATASAETVTCEAKAAGANAITFWPTE